MYSPRIQPTLGVLLILLVGPLAADEKTGHHDTHGDPLPEGAVARLGTVRLRHAAEVNGIAFSTNGKSLVSGSRDGTARLWDAASGHERSRFRVAEYGIDSIALSPDGKLLACGADQAVLLLDSAAGKEVRRCGKGLGGIRSLAFSPDGKAVLSVSGDRTARLWSVDTGKALRRIGGENVAFPPEHFAFSPDGKTLATAGVTGTVSLQDWTTGKEIRLLKGHKDSVKSLAFSPDGKLLASGGSDRAIRLWDPATGRTVRQLEGHEDEVSSVAFARGADALVSGSRDYTVRIWDLKSGKQRHRIQQTHWVKVVVASPDGRTVASAGVTGVIRHWNTSTGEERLGASGHSDAVTTVAYLDGRRLVSGGKDRTVRLWEAGTGKELRRFTAHTEEVEAVACHPDGKVIASSGEYREAYVWEAATGKVLWRVGESGAGAVAFSPDGKLLASGQWADGPLYLWDVASGKQVRKCVGHEKTPHALAFSPDGRVLASSALLERVIRFWDVSTGKERGKITGGLGSNHSLAFTPDGRWLVSEGRGDKISLWDPSTGKEDQRFVGHHGYVVLALSPDGRTLASGAFGGRDREVRLYETLTGGERQRFHGHQSPVRSVAFSPDGQRLVSASEDSSLLVWDLTGKLDQDSVKVGRLGAQELEALWTALSDRDAAKAYRAIKGLAAMPEQAVPLLRGRLRPVPRVDPGRIGRLIAELDSKQSRVREAAAQELEELERVAAQALRKALEAGPSLEVRRRLESLLGRLEGTDLLPSHRRGLRALEVLERVRSPDATNLLQALAGGAPEARLTQEAQAARSRLNGRRPRP